MFNIITKVFIPRIYLLRYFLLSDQKKVTKEKSPAAEKLSKIILTSLQENNSSRFVTHHRCDLRDSNRFSCYASFE